MTDQNIYVEDWAHEAALRHWVNWVSAAPHKGRMTEEQFDRGINSYCAFNAIEAGSADFDRIRNLARPLARM